MDAEEQTPLQRFVIALVDALPEARDHYDRRYQERTGTKGKPLYDIQRGKSREPSPSTLKALAEVTGQPYDLFRRAADGEDVKPLGMRPTSTSEVPDVPPTRDGSEGETVSITALDLSYSMGPGTNIDGYIEENPIEMDVGFLRRITRAEFARLRLARGVGDSMYPTLLHSDVVLIDTTQTQLAQQDRIYAISLYGASAIKRLRRIGPDRILVKSDNPGVDDQEVLAEDLYIDGRVIWFGRAL